MMSLHLLRPEHVCRSLLAALKAADGRSRSRKRDQTPDSIGLSLRHDLLEQAIQDNPAPDDFEQWLLDRTETSPSPGAAQTIVRAVLEDWRLAHRLGAFAEWLEHGAPSDDARTCGPAPSRQQGPLVRPE
jgi:hypothetical protein